MFYISFNLPIQSSGKKICLKDTYEFFPKYHLPSNDGPIEFSALCRSIMTKPIKLFQNVQKIYQMMSIYPPQSNQNCTFNIKNLCILLSMVSVTIASIAYVLFDTRSAVEYGRCCIAIFSELEMILYFFVQFSKMPRIRKLIENFEAFIKKSEYFPTFSLKLALKQREICIFFMLKN